MKSPNEHVNLTSMKSFVKERFKPESRFRQIILAERDYLSWEEFIIKVDVYLRLGHLDIEAGLYYK